MRQPDYQRDGITLYCGDCLEVLPELGAGTVDAVVTDPPYGIGFKYNSHEDAPAFYKDICNRVLACEDLLCDGGFVAVYQSEIRAKQWASDIPRDWHIIVLPKTFTQGGRGAIVPSTDFVLWWRHGEGDRPKDWQEVFARNWFVCNTAPAKRCPLSRKHPCPRPVDGAEYLVKCFSRRAQTILDPFMGSGTTGVACVKTGRKFVGIEIDRGYFDIAVSRIEKAMAEKGELLPMGVT